MAIPGAQPEGTVSIKAQEIEGHFGDGSTYTLRSPIYEIIPSESYLAPEADLMIGPRLAPPYMDRACSRPFLIPKFSPILNPTTKTATGYPADPIEPGTPEHNNTNWADSEGSQIDRPYPSKRPSPFFRDFGNHLPGFLPQRIP